MKYFKPDIRGKLRFLLSVSIFGFILFGVISLSSIFTLYDSLNMEQKLLSEGMAAYTEQFAKSEERKYMMEVGRARANLIRNEAAAMVEDVQYLSFKLSAMLNSPESFLPRELPNALYDSVTSGEPYVHFSPELLQRGVDENLMNEIRVVSNLADDQRFLGKEYSTLFLGSRHGYTIMMHIMPDDKDMVSLSREPWRSSYDPRQRGWYQLGIGKSRPSFTEVYISTGGFPCFSCVMPYYGKDGFEGIVGVDINLKDFGFLMENTAAGEGEISFILGSNGEILFTTEDEGILSAEELQGDLRQSDSLDIADIALRMIAGEEDVMPITLNGRECYIAFAPIPSLGWSVASVIDHEIAMAPVDKARERTAKHMAAFRSMMLLKILFCVMVGAGIFAIVLWLLFRSIEGVAERFSLPIRKLTEGVKEIARGNLDRKLILSTGDEIEYLANCMNSMTSELKSEMERVAAAASERERTATEMRVSSKIQLALLPNTFPAFPERNEFDIYAAMKPAKDVGGDFYDYYLVDGDHLAITIGDVSGKGVPAALFMAAAKTQLKNFILKTKNGEDLAGAIACANGQICDSNEAGMFVTGFIGILQLTSGRFSYVNAGNLPPFIKRRGAGAYESLPVPTRKTPMGMSKDIAFEVETICLHVGDRLFFFTDGVPEAKNKDGDMFTVETLRVILNQADEGSARDVIVRVENSLSEHIGDAEDSDDLSMIAFEYKGPQIIEADNMGGNDNG